MKRYIYDGPVYKFNRICKSNITLETCACSLEKAISNLSYQAKRACGCGAGAKVSIDKTLVVVEQNDISDILFDCNDIRVEDEPVSRRFNAETGDTEILTVLGWMAITEDDK